MNKNTRSNPSHLKLVHSTSAPKVDPKARRLAILEGVLSPDPVRAQTCLHMILDHLDGRSSRLHKVG